MNHTQCMKVGRLAEEQFAGHLTNPIFSTDAEDMKYHWDVMDNMGNRYDVKAMKKWRRDDPEATDRMHYVELRNVKGELGWLYGTAHYIVFETRKYWLIVPRNILAPIVEEMTAHGQHTPTPQPYKLYQREGRKDLMTVVPTVDLLAISNQVIKKYNNTNEQ